MYTIFGMKMVNQGLKVTDSVKVHTFKCNEKKSYDNASKSKKHKIDCKGKIKMYVKIVEINGNLSMDVDYGKNILQFQPHSEKCPDSKFNDFIQDKLKNQSKEQNRGNSNNGSDDSTDIDVSNDNNAYSSSDELVIPQLDFNDNVVKIPNKISKEKTSINTSSIDSAINLDYSSNISNDTLAKCSTVDEVSRKIKERLIGKDNHLIRSSFPEIDEFDKEVFESDRIPRKLCSLLHCETNSDVYENIKKQYNKIEKQIYFWIDSILLVINPFSKQNEFNTITLIAEGLLDKIVNKQKNQSLIISGESGAGKTETSKNCIISLTNQLQSMNQSLHEKLVSANAILEVLGNAKTVNNNNRHVMIELKCKKRLTFYCILNSSRFGKFIKLFYDISNSCSKLKAVEINTYLFEKNRVTNMQENNYNYHIFYTLIELLKNDEYANLKDELQLNIENEFKYLAPLESNNDYLIKFKNEEIKQHLSILGFENNLLSYIYKLVAVILHLGNIELKITKTNSSNNVIDIVENSSFIALLHILGDDKKSLNKIKMILSNYILKTDHKIFKLNNDLQKAKLKIKSLARSIYFELFKFMVQLINSKLCLGKEKYCNRYENFIGILDIFGFENFTSGNGYEQFLINYTNEKLQFQFYNTILENINSHEESEECILFEQSKRTVEQLTKLVGLVGDASKQRNITPARMYHSFFKDSNSDVYRKSKIQDRSLNENNLTFTIRHYAENVVYDSIHFVEKDKDEYVDLKQFQSSLFEKLQNSSNTTIVKNGDCKSVATLYNSNLQRLMKIIDNTQIQYIRCIKPNNTKEPFALDEELVKKQLNGFGVVSTIKILANKHNRLNNNCTKRNFLTNAEETVSSISTDKSVEQLNEIKMKNDCFVDDHKSLRQIESTPKNIVLDNEVKEAKNIRNLNSLIYEVEQNDYNQQNKENSIYNTSKKRKNENEVASPTKMLRIELPKQNLIFEIERGIEIIKKDDLHYVFTYAKENEKE